MANTPYTYTFSTVRREEKVKPSLINLYVKQVENLWFCLGLLNDEVVRFVSFSPKSLGETLQLGLNLLREGEETVRKVKASGKVEEIFEILHAAYMGGGVKSLPPLAWERLPLFTRKVLRLTLRVPRGFVASYGDLARALGSSKYSRAVGLAMALNPFPLLIPCHRIVRENLALGGYRFGVRVKAEILTREGVGLERRSRSFKVKPEFRFHGRLYIEKNLCSPSL